jgi:hypothetical protein
MPIPVVAAALALAVAQAQPRPPFRDLGVDGALAAALAEKKPAVIYFRGAGDPACERMEREVFTDPTLSRWLAEQTVAVRIDLDGAEETQRRFAVESVPSVVFLLASGQELDRLGGFRTAQEVFEEAPKIVRGGEALAEARRRFAESAATPLAHVKFARVLAALERHGAALERYLWAWDNGAFDPSFARDRSKVVPLEIASLAQRYKPAHRALVERRNAAGVALGELAEGADGVRLARDFGSINVALKKERETLEVFDALASGGKAPQPVLAALLDEGVAPLLASAGRFTDLLAARGDVLAHFDLLVAQYARDVADASAYAQLAESSSTPDAVDTAQRVIEIRRNQTVSEAATYCEALVATGAKDTAREVAARIGRAIPRARTYFALARGAAEGGDVELARAIGAAGLAALSDAQDREELVRLLERLEERDPQRAKPDKRGGGR